MLLSRKVVKDKVYSDVHIVKRNTEECFTFAYDCDASIKCKGCKYYKKEDVRACLRFCGRQPE